MRQIDHEIRERLESSITYGQLNEWRGDNSILDYGALILCISGKGDLFVNFSTYSLETDKVIVMFPNDVVQLTAWTEDFKVQILSYSSSMLREASLQLEQTIYSAMREDRCRRHEPRLTSVVKDTFSLASAYFNQKGCTCSEQIVLLLLKAFFLGYHDYLQRNPEERPVLQGSNRTQDLFGQFMNLVSTYYRQSQEVCFYADKLNICPKHLNCIVQQMTRHTPKVIIDHFVILQIKLQLRNTSKTVNEIANEFHFTDTSYFCRYFKKHTGIAPRQFRRP